MTYLSQIMLTKKYKIKILDFDFWAIFHYRPKCRQTFGQFFPLKKLPKWRKSPNLVTLWRQWNSSSSENSCLLRQVLRLIRVFQKLPTNTPPASSETIVKIQQFQLW